MEVTNHITPEKNGRENICLYHMIFTESDCIMPVPSCKLQFLSLYSSLLFHLGKPNKIVSHKTFTQIKSPPIEKNHRKFYQWFSRKPPAMPSASHFFDVRKPPSAALWSRSFGRNPAKATAGTPAGRRPQNSCCSRGWPENGLEMGMGNTSAGFPEKKIMNICCDRGCMWPL